jgi:hypothetical protein
MMCVYALPDNRKLQAFLFAHDGEDASIDGQATMLHAAPKHMSQREKALQFMQLIRIS